MSDIQIEVVKQTIEIETPQQVVELEVPRFVHIDNSYWPQWPTWPAWPTWPQWDPWQIQSINSLTDASQTITIWLSGNDINIVSALWDHKINIPTASSTKRGALSSADWTTFNSKMTSPMTTLGDIIYGWASWSPTRLWWNTTTDQYILWSQWDWTNAQDPSWVNLTSTLSNYVTNTSLSSTLSSYVTNTSLSSTLLWYQTAGNYITALTWDVTASWPWSVSSTIANSAVTFAKMQNISTAKLLWRYDSWSWVIQEITIWSWLSLSALWVLTASWWWGWWITIGTTTITSGTNKRVLFDDSWVVGESASFLFDKTDKYLDIDSIRISRKYSGTCYVWDFPTAMSWVNNGTALWVGAGASITSGTLFLTAWYKSANTATTQINFVSLWPQANLNATGTRCFALWYNSQANNSWTDCFSMWSLTMVNATWEIGSTFGWTNSWSWATTWFYNTFRWDAVWWWTANSRGNTHFGARWWNTVGGSFNASNNSTFGYDSDAAAWIKWFIGIGSWVRWLTSNTIIIGWTRSAPTRMYIGLGETSATPTSITISPTNGVWTNIAGADLILAWSQPTWSWVWWKIKFQTATQWTTWTTLHPLVTRLDIDENANIRAYGLHNNATAQGNSTNQDIRSGTYTPTLTWVTNVASSTARKCQWMRVGNVVTVSGQIDITATANNTQTTIGISLPIASNFWTSYECGGTWHTLANTVAWHGLSIYADATNNRAEADYFETHWVTDTFSFHFTYEVI